MVGVKHMDLGDKGVEKGEENCRDVAKLSSPEFFRNMWRSYIARVVANQNFLKSVSLTGPSDLSASGII